MTDTFDPTLERKISSLVEAQFPNIYRDEGPVFVQFVKEYYRWLEGSQIVANTTYSGKGYLVVTAKQANVVGQGTDFTKFANGDAIAIYYEDSKTDYDLFTIDTIANNTFLSLTTDSLPGFSSINSAYSTTKTQYNPNYYLRRYLDNKDVDNTAEQFIVYFKEKYLKNIHYTTKSNIKTLLKHSLDLYRSKGTERAIDLLFRSVFGQPSSVYYPGNDIFKLSDGKWYRPTYLEISIKKDSDKLVGKQIVGAISGATAFAETLIRRTIKNRLIDVLYISAVNGNFLIDEPINSSDNVLSIEKRPFITGSLTEIVLDPAGSGANYTLGDTVELYSDYGEQGKGRVTSTTNATGLVTFSLVNGGYGYSANAEVLVSDKIVVVSNVSIDANNPGYSYVDVFDYAVQPLANIVYSGGTGQFANGDMVYTWTTGVVNGTAKVLKSVPSNTTDGYILVNIISGNLDHTTLYSDSNTFNITKVSYTDATCIGNTIGYYSNVVIDIASKTGNFQNEEEIYQTNLSGVQIANATLDLYSANTSTTGTMRLSNTAGVFKNGLRLRGRNSNASANIQNQRLYVGMTNVSNQFYTDDGNYIHFANSLTNATVTSVSLGSLANVGFSNNLVYTETVEVANDYIRDYLTVEIDATAYGFPKMPSGNLTSGTLQDMLANVEAYTIGKIFQLTGINRGTGYNLAPIVKVYDPIITHHYIKDVELRITGLTKPFIAGELVTQELNGSRGIVKEANSTHVWVERMRFLEANNFIVTSGETSKLHGEFSGAYANVTIVNVDETSGFLGFNADLNAEAKTVSGAVTGIAIMDSGFGYKKADSLRFVKTGLPYNHEDGGLAFANLINQGYSEGYYKRKGGWLSDQSKIFDGYYYQEYSYEIRASLMLNKYEDMLKQLLHVAGTKYFGAFVYPTKTSANTVFHNVTIEQT